MNISRIMKTAAAMAVGMMLPLGAYATNGPFTDVPDSHLFANDIAWMHENGITKGCNPPANTQFCPDDDISRGEVAAFFHRFSHWVTANTGSDTLETGSVSGPQGEKGETGPQGEKGDTGPQGEKGETGAQGEKGDTGDKGDTGPQGDIGPQGPQGDKGDTGPQGEKGDPGPQGEPGAAGGFAGVTVTTAQGSWSGGQQAQSVTATCPAGHLVVSGGFDIDSNNASWVVTSSRPSSNGWTVAAAGAGSTTVTAYAVCAEI